MTQLDPRQGYLARLQNGLAGRYLIDREIGAGGMAIVYLARDLRHDRAVAIKLLLPEVTSVVGAERFIREIRLTAALQYPHILPLHDSGETDGLLYAVMPYVTGGTLRQRLEREGHLPVDETIALVGKVARALDHAHQQGIIHRDVKPENVLLHNGEPLLADFGIALPLTEAEAARITSRGISVGTPQYMSPEQAVAERSLTPASDVYSLGAVAYEMLVGEPPVTGPSTKAMIARLLTESPRGIRTVRETVPARVEAVVLKALAKSPVDRHQTAGELADALQEAEREAPDSIPPHTARRYRTRAMIALGIALFLLAVGGTWWNAISSGTGDERLKSIALLPCESLGRESSQAHVADRWTEELINKLFKVGDLRPKSWLSVNRYRATAKTAQQIGTELDAGSLVRCRFAEEPPRVRLEVQLIRSDDDRVIWSNLYDEPAGIEGVNAVQSAAALDIARTLNAGASRPSAVAVGQPLTRDSAALRLYRLGRHFFFKGGPRDMHLSVQYFKDAIARDSAFARAYVGLADAMGILGERERPASEWQPEVERYLRRAIALDETIAEAHSLLGLYYMEYAYDPLSAEEQHQRAIQLNPNSADAHLWYGYHLLLSEKVDRSIVEFQRAVNLDATMPLARAQLARALLFAGRRDLAMPHLRAGMEMYPDWGMWPHFLAMDLVQRQVNDSALAMLNRGQETIWDGWLYALAGRPDTAQRILDSLLVQSERRWVNPVVIATLHIGLGNKEETLAWLERSYSERSSALRFFLGLHPAMNPIRHDPRFRALRRRVGLPR